MEYTALEYKGFEEDLVEEHTSYSGTGFVYKFFFDNGYGVSVIKHEYSYGNEEDLFEVAVLYNDRVVYDERIFRGNGLQGWMTNSDVLDILKDVKEL